MKTRDQFLDELSQMEDDLRERIYHLNHEVDDPSDDEEKELHSLSDLLKLVEVAATIV